MRITYSKGIATVTFDSHDRVYTQLDETDQSPSSKFRLDDLPENVLVEILCRLPCKFAVQCKCVCKSWSTLISHPYFQSRRALYILNYCDDNERILMFVILGRRPIELFTISKQKTHPVLKSLNYLPSSLIHSLDKEMKVVGTYNDLILLREAILDSHKYYICNIYTKQWVALPPTNRFPERLYVGFICESDYRCRVVRLLDIIPEPPFRIKVEVFSSETGKWTESVVKSLKCPQSFGPFDLQYCTLALAYDGWLYCQYQLGPGGFLIGLEPFKLDHSHHCRFISKPPVDIPELGFIECLGVCRGIVRLCRLYYSTNNWLTLYVWELKEEDDSSEVDRVGGKMMKWSLKETVELGEIGLVLDDDDVLFLAFDPSDEDIMLITYRRRRVRRGFRVHRADTVTCNIRTKEVINTVICYDNQVEAFPFVLPWWRWPTPVPRVLDCQTN